MFFRNAKLSTKLVALPIVAAICMAMIFVYLVPYISNRLFQGKQMEVKQLVESATSMLGYYKKQAESGKMTPEAAQAAAKAAVAEMRYSGDQYLWINDYAPKMVMHPFKPELNGSDLSDNKDPDGKRLFMEMVRVCREKGEGFVDYKWPKPGQSVPAPKISFVKGVPGWDWIVGTGIYIDEVSAEVNRLLYVILGVAAAVFLGSVLLGWLFARSVGGPVRRSVDIITQGTEQMATAARQVNSASQQLASGSSEQAASLEETAASLEELASMTRQNADHAKQAKGLMSEVTTTVGEANSAMNDLRQAMGQITSASDQTAKIIKTIDEIAFQTNLLALNAAVEAARAGEAGAGFAVVADEVRNLAMRAAEAARSTTALIEGNIQNINTGSNLVTRADQSFVKVEESARKVDHLINEIAAASGEQSQGIDQISRAMSEMDKVTQQNAAGAQETAAAAEEMSAQSMHMLETVTDLSGMVEGQKKARSRRAGKGGAPRPKALPAKPAAAKRPLLPRPAGGQSAGKKAIPLDDSEADFKDF